MGKLIQLSCPTCGARLEMEGTEGPIFGTCTTCGNWYAYEQEHSYAAKNDIGYLMCGIDHLEMENWDYAKEEFEKYVKKHPKDYRGWLGLWLAGDADERVSKNIYCTGYRYVGGTDGRQLSELHIYLPRKVMCETSERILTMAPTSIKPRLGNMMWFSDEFENNSYKGIEGLREYVSYLQKEKADLESSHQRRIDWVNQDMASRKAKKEAEMQKEAKETKQAILFGIPGFSAMLGGVAWLISGNFLVPAILACVVLGIGGWLFFQKIEKDSIRQCEKDVSEIKADSLKDIENIEKEQKSWLAKKVKEIEEASKTLSEAESVMEEYKHDIEGMVSDESLIALLKEEILLSVKSK